MTEYDDESLGSVGGELVDHANEFGSPMRLPIITQLFPFLLLASRRMTTREMSDWLAKQKGVKISAPMITKGLKRPDLHLRRIAEYAQPLAAFVCAVHDLDVEAILFGDDVRKGRSHLSELADELLSAPDEVTTDAVREALSSLMEFWEPIPQEVQFMCRRYFDFPAVGQAVESDDENSEELEES